MIGVFEGWIILKSDLRIGDVNKFLSYHETEPLAWR